MTNHEFYVCMCVLRVSRDEDSVSVDPTTRHIVSSLSGFRYNYLFWIQLHTARRIKEIAVYRIVFINRVYYC